MSLLRTARLVEEGGRAFVVNGNGRKAATPYERQLFKLIGGELGTLDRLEMPWGLVIAGHGDWFSDPAKCRDVAQALEGRAQRLEGNSLRR